MHEITSQEPGAAAGSPVRRRVGIALGGGVGRSFAHLGVLEVLEHAGLQFDCVAGTSGGALVGAFYCAGVPVDEIRARARDLNWLRLARLVWPSQGFISFDPLERWLAAEIGDLTFADLKRPFAVVATDIVKGERVVLREGRVAHAVHASCAVPGFVRPVPHEGRLLVDGGISDNVPAAVVRTLGADYAIGVDLFVSHIRSRLGALGYGLAAIETMVRNAGGGLKSADCCISPDLAGFGYLGLSAGTQARIIEKGVRAAEAQLDGILAALGMPPAAEAYPAAVQRA